ncbi:unnamed protein product [Danaus chrysippus]|uniref:(African queen) hypothetical protein n=1 Tax=Danaus chrysippus TaxID=151541 RepID=A0A8J2W9Y5_9NEOP|nr:unnamed protein product [Danaus chrysippus]
MRTTFRPLCCAVRSGFENPAEKTAQEAPTTPVGSTEIPKDLPSTKTPQFHPIPINNNFSFQDNDLMPTNDENLPPPESVYLNPKPGCSWMPDSPPRTIANTNFSITSPKDLIPLPKINSVMKRVIKKRGKTAILTASPYKIEL